MTFWLWWLIAALFGITAAAPPVADVEPGPAASTASPTVSPTPSAGTQSE